MTSLTLLIGAGPALAGQQPVLPQGGGFVAGVGTIAGSGSALAITQSSLRGIINWNSFSIGKGGLVQFNNGSGATLNRVTGVQQSRLFGTLSATGSVYLLNPSGVLIGKSGSVNTGGSFVASTLDTSNDAFMAGGALTLSGSSGAAVKNYGTITANGGDVLLVARTVANDGSIAAPNGTAGLAAGQQVLLQPSGGDQRIFIEAPGGDVTNTGTIAAAAAELKAAGGNVYALAGNNGGQISATGTKTINGHVWLIASGGGSVMVSGQLSAKNADGSGGTIQVTGTNVALASTASLDASGTSGGTIEIGGGLHGADASLANAENTSVAAGAVINASATGNGNGGTVAVWSNGATVFDGTILANGGPLGGKGGTVETSGKGTLSIGPTALVSAAAPNGTAGSWLLDPDSDVDITNATSNVTCSSGVCSPTADSSTLDAATIATALNAGTNVTVQTSNPSGTQSGNITVDSGISLTSAKTVTLTLDAGSGGGAGAITLNQAISDAGSGGALSLVLNAGGGIAFNNTASLAGSLSATAGTNAAGNITLGSNGFLQVAGAASFTNESSNGSITLSGANTVGQLRGGVSFVTTGSSATLHFSNDSAAAGTVLGASTFTGTASLVDSSGSISQSGALTGNGGVSFSTTTSNATITLDTQTNTLNGSVGFATSGSGGNVRFKNKGGTTLRGLTVGGSVSILDTTSSISQLATSLHVVGAATFQTQGSGQTITLDDPINQFSGAVSFLTTGSGADVTFINTGGTNLGASTVGGALSATDGTSAITVSGALSANSLSLTAGSGSTITFNDGTDPVTVSTSGGGQNYNSDVSLQADTVLRETGGGTITLGKIDGAHKLSVLASNGFVTLSGAVGSGTPLSSLTVTSDTTLNGNVTTSSGGQTYNAGTNGGIALGSSIQLTDTGPGDALTFNGQITGGANTLTLSTSGAESFAGITSGGLILGTPSALTLDSGVYTIGSGTYTFATAATIDAPGSGILILGNSTTTFGGGLTLANDTIFDSSAAHGSITFNGAIDGGKNFTVNAGTGVVTFGAAVGAITPLHSVSVTSDPVINANVTTSGGGQTYNGPITLGGPVTLTDTGGGALALNGQVTGGANSLTLSTTGAETLSGVTTSGNLILGVPSALTLDAGTYTITGGANPYVFGAATVNGTLFFGMNTTFGALTLGSNTVINALANQNFIFNGAIDGGFDLQTVSGNSGQITLNQAIGAGTALTGFSAQAGTIAFSGSGATITTTAGNLGIDLVSLANGLTLPASLNAGSGSVLLNAAGGAIDQTSGVITAASLTTISTTGTTLIDANAVSSFTASNTTSGNIVLGDHVAALTVQAVSNTGGGVSVTNNLGTLTTTGAVSSAANSGISLAASGTVQVSAGSRVTANGSGDVTLITTGGAIAIDGSVASTSGTVTLNALGGGISESGLGAVSTSGQLSAHAHLGIVLQNANAVGSFGASAVNGITLDNTAPALTVTGALATAGSIDIENSGGLVLTGALTAGAGGNAIVLSATGNFTNSAGASALTVGAGGRWLVYSAAPAGDSFGGLDSGNTAIWDATLATLPPASVTASGDRYLFAQQPTATFTAKNVTKSYGTSVDLSADYTVSGLQSGVAGAYLGDSNASVFSGAASLSSAGAAASANTGVYSIAISQGSLAALNGYAFAFVNGQLSIGQQTLTYVANPAVRLLGEPNPVFTGTVTGLSGATGVTGTAVFSSSATSASPGGSYAIDGSGLGGGNFVFAQAPGNATALTVLPFGMPSVLPPSSTTLVGQTAPSGHFSPAPLLATLEPRAGCTVTPQGDCIAPLAAATFPSFLAGSEDDRAPPVRPW